MLFVLLIILLIILCIVSCRSRSCRSRSCRSCSKETELFISNDFKNIIRKNTNWVSLDSGNYQGINSVYVIALPDRLNYVRGILDKLGIKANILDAFDKKNADNFPKEIITNFHGNTGGKIACQVSHSQVLLHFLESENETALILEDDIKLINGIDKEKIGSFVKDVVKKDPNWSMIYLGYCYEPIKSLESKSEIITLKRPECTHAYIVNKKSAKILLDNFYPMKTPIDTKIAKLIESGKLISYGPKNMFFGQNEKFESTIGNIKGAGNNQFSK